MPNVRKNQDLVRDGDGSDSHNHSVQANDCMT